MRRVSLGRLTRIFAWIGLTSVGGGRSAYIYEALVVRRAWLTGAEFLPGLTLSQLLPGPTVSNLSVFLGNSLNGRAGAALALLAVLLPGALAILVLGALYFEYGVGPALESALRGMGAAVVGFLCVNTTRIARGAFRGRGAPWIAATTFAAVGLLRLNTILVILVAGAVSLWLNRPGRPGTEPLAAGETDAC
jgi:chromate transporter